ncbi:MAG: hypothetical protein NTW78_09240 [Campylobacterales bacterium]|nr:hypothetical protein [Campylobacterales bacterium]
MQNTVNQELDKFELHLDEMIIKIQKCQEEKSVKSCSRCEQYFACELRNNYVKSVYNSMSKGETGGFEF